MKVSSGWLRSSSTAVESVRRALRRVSASGQRQARSRWAWPVSKSAPTGGKRSRSAARSWSSTPWAPATEARSSSVRAGECGSRSRGSSQTLRISGVSLTREMYGRVALGSTSARSARSPGLHQAGDRLMGAEHARGDRDQVEPPDQALERDVDPGEASERQPRVTRRLAEREPRHDLDLDRKRLSPHREHAVPLVEAERGPAQGQQPLAAQIELQPRLPGRPALGHAHLRMRQPPHTVAARPRRPERQRLAVEAPVAELHPLPDKPSTQLVGAGGEPVQPLFDAQGDGALSTQPRTRCTPSAESSTPAWTFSATGQSEDRCATRSTA